jgi:tetratricopeptide (TPR) repeat protein
MSNRRRFLALALPLLIVANLCHAGDGKKGAYPFKVPTAKALELLDGLGTATASADEKSLFAEVAGGKLDKWPFDEAALLASGVTDAAKRKQYLARIDALEAEARKATAGAKAPRDTGEKLLRFLHDGPMAKGYAADQTLLDSLLDTGKYNCVSSAVLYNVLARRLGLEVRAVGVTGHVYSVLHADGKTIDVETTNAHGFDVTSPEQRDKLRKEKGIEVLASKHGEKGRELREPGLVATIYSNRSAALAKAARYHEAAVAGFCGLSLDPESPNAANNALAALTNWSLALSKDGKHEDAVRVASTGLAMGPRDDSSLRRNRIVIWGRWAEALVKAGKEDEALALLGRASGEARPEDKREVLGIQVSLYARPGEELVKKDDWEKALDLAEGGLRKVDKGVEKDLRHWRNGVYLRWSDAETAKGNFERAVAALEKGMAADPRESDFANNLGCLVRDRALQLHAAGKPKEAKAELLAMQKRFAKCKDVQRAGRQFVQLAMQEPLKQSNFDKALDTLDAYAEVVVDKTELQELAAGVYYKEAKPFLDGQKWTEAMAVFEKGLKRYPGNRDLTHNLEVCRERAKK